MKKYPAPRDFPKLITVNKAIYHITFFTKLTQDDHGFCDADSKIIGLSRNQTRKEMFSTLVHEVIHALEAEYNLPIGHARINKIEEVIIDLLSHF